MSSFSSALGRVEKLPAFAGQDGEFEDWAFRARSTLAMLHEDVDEYLATAELSPSAIWQGILTAEARVVSKAVFHHLSQVLTGRAGLLARTAERGNGFELWRRLHERWRLTASGATTALLVQFLSPFWEAVMRAQDLSFPEVLEQWDLDCDRYEVRSGDRISFGTRLATAVRHGPAELAQELRREAAACDGDFDRFLGALRLFVATAAVYDCAGFLDKGPGLPGRGSADMDVGAVVKGGGKKGGSKFSGSCYSCGKIGHRSSECRSTAATAGSAPPAGARAEGSGQGRLGV